MTAPLIATAASEAAVRLSALDPDRWAGLMLSVYGASLTAVRWGRPDLEPLLGIDGDTMDGLGMPDGDGAALTTVRERVEDGEAWGAPGRGEGSLLARSGRMPVTPSDGSPH